MINKNLSILTKVECKGGNEWRTGEYIIEFTKKGYNVNIYCHKSFNNTIKKHVCESIGDDWLSSIHENMDFKIKCRPDEVLILSPVDEYYFASSQYINDLLIDKQNIKKMIININWLREYLEVLEKIVGPEKTAYMCANKTIQKFYDDKKVHSTIHLPSPINRVFKDVSIDYDNTTIGRHSRPFHYKFSEVYRDIVRDHPSWNFLLMGVDKENGKRVSKYTNAEVLTEFSVPSWEFLSRIGIFLQINREDYIEMSPRVVAEAMMAGLPVVAENRDGAKDQIIHEETGILIDYKDTSQINHYLDRLVRDKEFRMMLGKNAKEYALNNFTSESIVEQIDRLIIK